MDGHTVGVDGGSIIPLLVRFKLVSSIVQCFDYIAESRRRRRSGYVQMLGAVAGTGKLVFITAQGLLMYFEPDKNAKMLAVLATHAPGATTAFDFLAKFVSDTTLSEKG